MGEFIFFQVTCDFKTTHEETTGILSGDMTNPISVAKVIINCPFSPTINC